MSGGPFDTSRHARRRLYLKAMAAAALGTAVGPAFAAAPRRVIVLNWDLTELMLSFGVTPVGVPAPAWYSSGIVTPPLPSGVVDIGLLFQPNYDLLYELRPDLMVITPSHASMKGSFERIAPTLTLGAYTTAPHPYDALRDEATTLARRLGVEARADAVLNDTTRVLAQSRAALDAAAAAGGYRPVYVAQIVDDRHLRVFGAGSMFDDVLHALGLRNAATAKQSGAGGLLVGRTSQAIVELDQLAKNPNACVLWVGTSTDAPVNPLQLNPVWRELPFSQPGRSATLPVISATGALISVQRFARATAGAMPAIHVL